MFSAIAAVAGIRELDPCIYGGPSLRISGDLLRSCRPRPTMEGCRRGSPSSWRLVVGGCAAALRRAQEWRAATLWRPWSER